MEPREEIIWKVMENPPELKRRGVVFGRSMEVLVLNWTKSLGIWHTASVTEGRESLTTVSTVGPYYRHQFRMEGRQSDETTD